jgi:hypothetical protein
MLGRGAETKFRRELRNTLTKRDKKVKRNVHFDIIDGVKQLLLSASLLLALGSSAFALTEEVDKLDSKASYSAVADTSNVVYFSKCTRDNLRPYEWKIWEGHYAIRSYIEPIATITVKRDPDEPFLPNAEPFIRKALGASARIGGNIVCYVALKKSMEGLGFYSVTFRAYRQFFLSGHTGWLQYYNEKLGKGPPLTLPQQDK